MAVAPTAFTQVFARLDGWREIGPGRWKARCPAHEDTKPSLSVLLGRRGDLLVKCHAGQGCTFAKIAGSLGLEKADFFGSAAGRKGVNP